MLQELRAQFRILTETHQDPQCSDCRFFQEEGINKPGVGTCHAALPVHHGEGEPTIAWPVVRPTDWCIAFMPNE